MTCTQARSTFSAYLDGVLTGSEMQGVARHLETCPGCEAEYRMLARTQELVRSLGPAKAPPELALRLRVALSQEASRSWSRQLEAFLLELRQGMNSLMVSATAGLASAVIFFGLLIGLATAPQSAAAGNDVPTLLYTPPQLDKSLFGINLNALNTEALVVETIVDAQGREQDYRILSGQEQNQHLRRQLDQMMIFTTFRPATTFGRPAPGRVVLSFSRIHVRG
ncbi:MAG: anti-sigma factor family protein [Terriglobales bacterium]